MSTVTSYGIRAETIHSAIARLTNNLVNINDETGQFLLRLPDGRVIDTKGWDGWEWTHGIGLYGLYHYHNLTSSATTLEIIKSWFDLQLSKGTTKNINTMAPFLTLAYLYEDSLKAGKENKTWYRWLDTWAEWAMHDLPRTKFGGFQHMTYLEENKEELWDDTLMMTVMPLAKIGLVLNRPEYVEEAKRQVLLHCQYLFDTETGLFFHGWKFGPTDPEPQIEGTTAGNSIGIPNLGHNFARARWARGNAWLTIFIPDFIELLNLPPSDPLRMHLVSILEAQCTALVSLQSEAGLWRTLLDISTKQGSYEESSATAGFAYGMLKAVRKRYLGQEFMEPAVRAVKAVLGKINPAGELQDVSFGTAMGKTLQHYKDIPITSMPYGQAMGIMCLGEFVGTFL